MKFLDDILQAILSLFGNRAGSTDNVGTSDNPPAPMSTVADTDDIPTKPVHSSVLPQQISASPNPPTYGGFPGGGTYEGFPVGTPQDDPTYYAFPMPPGGGTGGSGGSSPMPDYPNPPTYGGFPGGEGGTYGGFPDPTGTGTGSPNPPTYGGFPAYAGFPPSSDYEYFGTANQDITHDGVHVGVMDTTVKHQGGWASAAADTPTDPADGVMAVDDNKDTNPLSAKEDSHHGGS